MLSLTEEWGINVVWPNVPIVDLSPFLGVHILQYCLKLYLKKALQVLRGNSPINNPSGPISRHSLLIFIF